MNEAAENYRPVSLVIPLRNEEAPIDLLVASIASQTRQPDEVIFVDGGSRDRTVETLRGMISGESARQVIEAGPATPGRGRNVGIAAAQHEWIALTDAGIRLEPTWLEELTKMLSDATVEVVFGNYEPTSDSFIERCAALLYSHKKQFRGTGWMRGPFIASSLLRRRVWESIGGFRDLRAAEDLIFMEEIERGGFKTAWAPKALVWWQPQRTVAGTFRRFTAFSRANVAAGRQRHWHYGIARVYAISSVFVILALLHHAFWLVLPVLLLLARVGKSIWQRRDGRGILWFANPLQFFGVAMLLVVIDLATFRGWIQAVGQRLSKADATRREHAKDRSV